MGLGNVPNSIDFSFSRLEDLYTTNASSHKQTNNFFRHLHCYGQQCLAMDFPDFWRGGIVAGLVELEPAVHATPLLPPHGALRAALDHPDLSGARAQVPGPHGIAHSESALRRPARDGGGLRARRFESAADAEARVV